jgi:hypothetical protein
LVAPSGEEKNKRQEKNILRSWCGVDGEELGGCVAVPALEGYATQQSEFQTHKLPQSKDKKNVRICEALCTVVVVVYNSKKLAARPPNSALHLVLVEPLLDDGGIAVAVDMNLIEIRVFRETEDSAAADDHEQEKPQGAEDRAHTANRRSHWTP